MSALPSDFHPAVSAWFSSRFAAPSRAQELGWPVIAAAHQTPRHDVLLCAPTGSGKTLAAFMWAIDRLVADAEKGALADEVSVLYVSPLKALANDIRLNLEEPLNGICAKVAQLGRARPAIRAGLRTGDTTAGDRAAMVRRPPHILVTTPESLFILLTSMRFREKLRAVRYVIVDELHAVAGTKRGAHLMVTLERLDRLIRRSGGTRPVRIGLSATLNPIATLGHFLAGSEITREGGLEPRPVRIVRADDAPRQLDLQIIAPGPEVGALATHQHWEAMYESMAKLVAEHRTTLIFTLSRRWAERIALALQKKIGSDAVLAHHGSLARAERLAAEQKLKRGELKAIVATSSLELGIDVGAVDLVCQVDSPKSIAAAIQRIGRSGHTLGGIPKGRFFALTADDLLECAAAVRAIRCGRIDEVEIPRNSLDVAAQQIVAIAAEEEEIDETDLLELLRRVHNFADLDRETLRALLRQMATTLPERIQGAAPKIFYDPIGGRVRPRRSARLAAITSGGTIPEAGNYDVVVASEGRKIGDVEEDFAQESARGDIFSLGSMPWRILGISKNRLMVEAAPGMAPSLPFWQTEAGGRSPALSREVAMLREEVAAMLAAEAASSGGPADASAIATQSGRHAAEWLARECSLEPHAAAQAVAYVRRGLAALGAIPGERTIVVERFFDGLGGTQIVIHAPFGIRFNRALGLAIRKRLCQSFDFEIQASAIDDAVLLALNSRHSFPLAHILTMVTSKTARSVLTQALLDAPMFEVRFRHVATRALAVLRSAQGRKVPAWIQRLRTQELITALFPQRNACFDNRPPTIAIPSHFIVEETLRECLTETADLARLERLLDKLERGQVRVVCVDAVAPSVFAQRILLAWDYSFLDDGERANRRSRTVTMNRALAEDVFRTEDLAETLSTEAVARITAEVDGTAANARARNADELHEQIRAHGALPAQTLAAHVAGDAPAMLAQLERESRASRGRIAAGAAEIVVATEDLPLFRSAYPRGGFAARDQGAPAPSVEAACREIVRRTLATSGPLTAQEIVTRTALSDEAVAAALVALEAEGYVFRGRFTPHAEGRGIEQWCERYVLERIHRETLRRLRAELEPSDDRSFAAFRCRWMHLGSDRLEGGADGVRAVLEQLSGLDFTPAQWENAILPARLKDYRPEYLDLLCLSGEFSWIAAPGASAAGEFPARVAFVPRRGGSVGPPSTVDCGPQDQPVLEGLRTGGAQYLDQLADRVNLSERETLASLWRLAASGLVSNDSFAPLRLIAAERAASHGTANRRDRHGLNRRDAAARARLKSSLSGRWSLAPRAAREPAIGHEADREREVAALLLARHGILAREMLALEPIEMPWSQLVFALRRMEYAGAIRRGWFVRALSGEQYALPEALAILNSCRSEAASDPLALSAIDPANPFGVLLPGCGITREAGNLLVIDRGAVVLGLNGRDLVMPQPLPADGLRLAIDCLKRLRPKLAIETINGAPALASNHVATLATLGFHSDGRALRCDGLPGPVPARVAALEGLHGSIRP
ncbi:MAG TPA: DEAD/DEAH box helicase [Candidatus Binataceae bacterium]|nr:DEAD/DEAH box helicase [Candidatus Binataceae bacterium]